MFVVVTLVVAVIVRLVVVVVIVVVGHRGVVVDCLCHGGHVWGGFDGNGIARGGGDGHGGA